MKPLCYRQVYLPSQDVKPHFNGFSSFEVYALILPFFRRINSHELSFLPGIKFTGLPDSRTFFVCSITLTLGSHSVHLLVSESTHLDGMNLSLRYPQETVKRLLNSLNQPIFLIGRRWDNFVSNHCTTETIRAKRSKMQ